jgi:hypothetical protein
MTKAFNNSRFLAPETSFQARVLLLPGRKTEKFYGARERKKALYKNVGH